MPDTESQPIPKTQLLSEPTLSRALEAAYGMDQGSSRKLIGALRIWHPYGTIGPLPVEGMNIDGALEFGNESPDGGLLPLSKRIRTFTEEVEGSDPLVAEARKWIEQARILLFLGFGFNRQNMQLIGPMNAQVVQGVYATTYEMSGSDNRIIQAQIKELLRGSAGNEINVPITPANFTCRKLLSEFGRAIQSGQHAP